MKSSAIISLPEKDYLAILEIITQIHACRTRKDIRNCFHKQLLPLFQAQSAAWAWMDLDFSNYTMKNPKMLDAVNVPEGQFEQAEKMGTYQKSISEKFLTSTRQVMAYDVDVPREVFQKEKDSFFAEHPEYNSSTSFVNRVTTVISVNDLPDVSLGLGIQRETPNDQPYTLRDIRLMELLCPHLFQSIKTIALNEELTKYKALTEVLADIPTALALVNLRFRVIYCNSSFNDLLGIEPGCRLPRDLTDLMDHEIRKYEPAYLTETSTVELPFYKLPKGAFRLSLTFLNREGEEENKCWLLRLKPAVEPYTKRNLLMQEQGLTAREMEIAALVGDGMGDQEIGDRLFISVHTVKNHIKNIHQKLNVHTRGQLVAVLNPGKEEQFG